MFKKKKKEIHIAERNIANIMQALKIKENEIAENSKQAKKKSEANHGNEGTKEAKISQIHKKETCREELSISVTKNSDYKKVLADKVRQFTQTIDDVEYKIAQKKKEAGSTATELTNLESSKTDKLHLFGEHFLAIRDGVIPLFSTKYSAMLSLTRLCRH